jgi:NADH-quinone oxidoreductase subunit C
MTVFVRREDLPAVVQVLRDDPALRFELCSGSPGSTTRATTGRSCTRSTT